MISLEKIRCDRVSMKWTS